MGGLLFVGCGFDGSPAGGSNGSSGSAGHQNLGGASSGSPTGGTGAGAAGGFDADQGCGEAPRIAGSVLQPRVLMEEGEPSTSSPKFLPGAQSIHGTRCQGGRAADAGYGAQPHRNKPASRA